MTLNDLELLARYEQQHWEGQLSLVMCSVFQTDSQCWFSIYCNGGEDGASVWSICSFLQWPWLAVYRRASWVARHLMPAGLCPSLVGVSSRRPEEQGGGGLGVVSARLLYVHVGIE